MPHDHSVILPSEIQTHHDRIPIYGHDHTICAVQSGPWFDPETWDEARIPNDTDAVCIPEGLTVELTAALTCKEQVTALESVVAALRAGQPEPSIERHAVCRDLVIAGMVEAYLFDLTVRTITVLPTGHLAMSESALVTFLDEPIDTAFDPSQYGHGLLVIDGRLTIAGDVKTPWATLAAEIRAGDTALTLEAAPDGWLAGDVLVLPDTRQPAATADLDDANLRAERVTVASVDGAAVTLAEPVQFDHFGWRNQQGITELWPHVGNLSRSAVFASANPNGTRGHILVTGRAAVSGQYAELRELGRTTFQPLHSTIRNASGVVTQIGTNQIGRYPWHFHHCIGPLGLPAEVPQFEALGLAIVGSPKWGIAVHGSHHGYVGFNVIDGARGSGIVTETVHEYATTIESNLIIGRKGSGQRITERSDRNNPTGDFWHGSVGLGLDSAACTIRNNRIYDCKDGIGMAGFRTTIPKWPNFKGADPMTEGTLRGLVDPYFYPFDFPTNDNLVWGCWRGIETWTADSYLGGPEMFPGLTFVHCRTGTDLEDQRQTTTRAWKFYGDFAQIGSGAAALSFKDGYEFGHTHTDCEYRGYDTGYRMLWPHDFSTFVRCVFECKSAVFQPKGQMTRFNRGWTGTWADCTFLPVNGSLVFASGDYPKSDINALLKVASADRQFLYPIRYQLRPWTDGRNLDVFHWFQTASYVRSPAITAPSAYGDFPPGVNTNAQLITLGTPIFGAVMPANAEPLGGPIFFVAEAS